MTNETLTARVLKNLAEMHHRTTHSYEFDRMKRSVSPFLDHFGLNHFYYVKILPSGHYTTIGIHSQLHEFVFDCPEILRSTPCIRHPENLKTGISIDSDCIDPNYLDTMNIALIKFKTKFTICIRKKIDDGIELFGFGTKFIKKRVSENLINELPLTYKFIDFFLSENQKLIRIANENKVDIVPLFGRQFYEKEEDSSDSTNRAALLRHMGLEPPETLTEREMEILQYFAFGYPAKYIASKLYISVRTVENYIAGLKMKLNCKSKIELIKKSNQLNFKQTGS